MMTIGILLVVFPCISILFVGYIISADIHYTRALPTFRINKETRGDGSILYIVQKKLEPNTNRYFDHSFTRFITLEEARKYVDIESKKIADDMIVNKEVVG